VRKARAGRPALVFAPDRTPAFWIVPFHAGDRTCGFALVEQSLKVSQVATFGATADRKNWLPSEFFKHPPAVYIAEAREQYPELKAEKAYLSYWGSPSHWGWRIDTGQLDGLFIFMTPGGWTAILPGKLSGPDREG